MSMGDLFKDYDPKGAMNGLFAPAYIKGFEPSEKAVAAWQTENYGLTPEMVDQTRMPNPWQPPANVDPTAVAIAMRTGGGTGVSGTNLNLGDPKGSVDPEALRILAQGGKYNMSARRDAIAQQVAANTAAQNAYNAQQGAGVAGVTGRPTGMEGMLPLNFLNMRQPPAGTDFSRIGF